MAYHFDFFVGFEHFITFSHKNRPKVHRRQSTGSKIASFFSIQCDPVIQTAYELNGSMIPLFLFSIQCDPVIQTAYEQQCRTITDKGKRTFTIL